MAGTMAAAAADAAITTAAVGGIPSVKASVRDTGRDIMTHCGTVAAAAVAVVAVTADAAALVDAVALVVLADAVAVTVAAAVQIMAAAAINLI